MAIDISSWTRQLDLVVLTITVSCVVCFLYKAYHARRPFYLLQKQGMVRNPVLLNQSPQLDFQGQANMLTACSPC